MENGVKFKEFYEVLLDSEVDSIHTLMLIKLTVASASMFSLLPQ